MSEHISRKELKQDRIHDAIEHSAEAVYSHKQVTMIVLLVVLVIAAGYGIWSVYTERQTAALDSGRSFKSCHCIESGARCQFGPPGTPVLSALRS